LNAWRGAPFYTERERAALAWTEAVTNIRDGHVPDEVYETATKHFSEEELIDLTLTITTANTYNGFNISFRTPADVPRPWEKVVEDSVTSIGACLFPRRARVTDCIRWGCCRCLILWG
jgi:hypothetical protein